MHEDGRNKLERAAAGWLGPRRSSGEQVGLKGERTFAMSQRPPIQHRGGTGGMMMARITACGCTLADSSLARLAQPG